MIIFISCKEKESITKKASQNEEEFENVNLVSDNYKISINKDTCNIRYKDTVVIFFESRFNGDLIEIYTKDSIWSQRITTDERLGLAKEIILGSYENVRKFNFKVNNGPRINIDSLSCNFIFVNYSKSKELTVDFSNKFYLYN